MLSRTRLAELALAAVSLGTGFLGLEIATRWLAARGDAEPVASRYTEFDPVLGWRHVPGARVPFPRGDYAINRLGLRDAERGYQPRDGYGRVLLLGDSFAEGYSVPFEASVGPQLEGRLAEAGCRYEVINGGTVGWSTDQEYLFFHDEGWRYRPEIVVLLFYYNDVLYNGRASVGRTPKPLFHFTGGVARLGNVPLTPPEPAAPRSPEPPPSGSAALRWLRQQLAAAGIGARSGPEEPGLELSIFSRQPPRAIEDAWAFTVHILRELSREVGERGGRLLIAYVPSKMEVVESDWKRTRERYGVDDAVWDRHRLAALLSTAAGDVGAGSLDLTAALAARDRGLLGTPYHRGGGHWNALGHAVAAGEIERVLVGDGGLSHCGRRP